jgi:hypothetical protein
VTSNDTLLRELGRIAAVVDPAPDWVVALGRAALELRRLDAELADLVDDSALEDLPFARVRGSAGVRMLFYQGGDIGVELHVTRHDGRSSALGQVTGNHYSSVRVESPEHDFTVPVDDLGRFDVDELPDRLFRLHLVDPDRPTVITGWTTL